MAAYRLLFGVILLVGIPLIVNGQMLIKYDPGNRSLIPFDQPFYLQVDSIKSPKIQDVSLYEIVYDVNHKRMLYDPSQPDKIRPSSIIDKKNYTLYGTSLKILFPALRPDRDFDGLILSDFSTVHLKAALKINQEIYTNSINGTPAPTQIIKDLTDLAEDVNKPPVGAANGRAVWAYYKLHDYYNDIFNPTKIYYDSIINNNKHIVPLMDFTQNQIDILNKYVDQDVTTGYRFSALQNIKLDGEVIRVANGLLSANYHLPALAFKQEDWFDLNKRLANLSSSIAFTDSLDHAIGKIKGIAPTVHDSIRINLRAWAKALNENRQLLKRISKSITDGITKKSGEAYWISQGTSAPDIKTAGTRHFTIDAGLMNIGVMDNNSHYKSIQKLFFGLNIYFVSIDKNVNWKRIPVPTQPGQDETHNLESRYSYWQRLSLTAGFTLGSMQNKDFDNIYNGFSFTIGPGYRIGKYFRVGAGAALLKRITPNPLESKSSLVIGNYFSVSLDYDLLSLASNVTSALFK